MTTTSKYLLGTAVALTAIYIGGKMYQKHRDSKATGGDNNFSGCNGCGGGMNASGPSTGSSSTFKAKCPSGMDSVDSKGNVWCGGKIIGQIHYSN